MTHNTEWSESQKERLGILFSNFSEVEVAYNISQKFREIMNSREDIDKIKESYKSYVYNTQSKADFKGIIPAIMTEYQYIIACYKTKLAV